MEHNYFSLFCASMAEYLKLGNLKNKIQFKEKYLFPTLLEA
jgi:hypothetical protein